MIHFDETKLKAKVNESWTLDLTAIDQDGNQFYWSIVEAPQGVSIDATTTGQPSDQGYQAHAQLRWTATNQDRLDSEILLKVVDSRGGVALKRLKLQVDGANHVPVIAAIRDIVLTEGQSLSQQLLATDEDSDRLSMTVRNLPAGAEFDVATSELTVAAVEAVLSSKTKLVAITGAGNTIGTRPDLKAIGAAVHKVGALFYVDGVHLTPHAVISAKDIGADFFGFSFYKLMGPHCAAIAASPELLKTLNNDKLLPSTSNVPEKFEFGTLPYEIMAGAIAAIDFIAEMAPGAGKTRREKIVNSMKALEAYEEELLVYMEDAIKSLPGVTMYGHAKHRTPTLYFSFANHVSADIYKAMVAKKVNVPAHNFYALEVSRKLGLGDDGALRAGLAPYSTREDVDRLVGGLREVLSA